MYLTSYIYLTLIGGTLCKEHNTHPFPTPTALLLHFITSSLHHLPIYLHNSYNQPLSFLFISFLLI